MGLMYCQPGSHYARKAENPPIQGVSIGTQTRNPKMLQGDRPRPTANHPRPPRRQNLTPSGVTNPSWYSLTKGQPAHRRDTLGRHHHHRNLPPPALKASQQQRDPSLHTRSQYLSALSEGTRQ